MTKRKDVLGCIFAIELEMTSHKMTFITAYLYDVFLEDLTSGFGRISLFICRNHVFLFVQGYLGMLIYGALQKHLSK